VVSIGLPMEVFADWHFKIKDTIQALIKFAFVVHRAMLNGHFSTERHSYFASENNSRLTGFAFKA